MSDDWSFQHAYPDTPPNRALEVMAGWLVDNNACHPYCTFKSGTCPDYDPSDCIAALVHQAKEEAHGRA